MTNTEHLVERHVREYESRLRHLDELYERAHQAAVNLEDDHAIKTELATVRQQKTELHEKKETFKQMSLEHWREDTIQSAGPMAIWDVLAQKLEDLIERAEK